MTLILKDMQAWDPAGDDSDEEAVVDGATGAQDCPGGGQQETEGLHIAGEMLAGDTDRAGQRTGMGQIQIAGSLHLETERTCLGSFVVRHNGEDEEHTELSGS